jgi:glycosyltransferase involved in cell wall biosynthesis
MKHKTMIFISPGPTYNAHSELYQKQYKMLSKSFEGYIFTTSSVSENMAIGNFTYVSMKSNFNIFSRLKFFYFCIKNTVNILRKQRKIDLVTTYDPLTTGLIGLMVARIAKTKFAPEVNGVYTSPAEWLDGADKILVKVKKFIYPIIMKLVLKHADGIRLLFKKQIDPFRDVVNGKIIKDFHCFVPTDQFKNLEEKKEILFSGIPFKRKGLDILISAFKKIAPDYPDWKLKILGWFPDPTELNCAIGGHPQIYHHPPVHYSEMPKHIGSCAILVLPSRSEAMGRVLVEAMAAKKPIIGSDVDGIPNVINDGIDGLLVEPENVEDLAHKMDILMSNKELRQQLGEAGSKRAKEEFTEESYIKNVINFYNEVMTT